MASVVYNRAKARIANGDVVWANVDVMVLDASTTTPDNPDHDFVGDIVADEAAGTGYARQSVANIAITEVDADDEAVLDHDDATITAYGPDNPALFHVYFEFITDDTDHELLWCNDLQALAAGLRTPNGEDYIIRAPSGGVVAFTD